MEPWKKAQQQREAQRKKTAISNRKRLKAETVEAIDALVKVANSIVYDASEGLIYGHINLSLGDVAELSKQADKVKDSFSLGGNE